MHDPLQTVNSKAFPSLPTSPWLLKKPPGMRAPFPVLSHRWVLATYQGLSFIWNVLPLPQQAIFLSVRGREPIPSDDVLSLDSLLSSLCPFFCAEPAAWGTLQCGQAQPLPTSSLPLVWLTLLVGLGAKVSEGYRESPEMMTENDEKQAFSEARCAWTRFSLKFF